MRSRLAAINRLLEQRYGAKKSPERLRDPLDVLVGTILSQNTNDQNSRRAYDCMRETFPTWRDVMAAPLKELEAALKPGGLTRTKSRRIQTILRAIAAEGEPNLNGLKRLTDEEAEKRLLDFPGVGLKTARCVLLFALGRDVFPIDTHVYRVLRRLDIIPKSMSVDRAHAFVPSLIPPGKCYSLHMNLIAHGRQVCHPRGPQCHDCVLSRACPSAEQPANRERKLR